MRICVGYVQTDAMRDLEDVSFDLTFDDDARVVSPFSGSVSARAGDVHLQGQLEPLAGVALDDSHCLPANTGSIYTRHLVRFIPADGGKPVLGWLEAHRLEASIP